MPATRKCMAGCAKGRQLGAPGLRQTCNETCPVVQVGTHFTGTYVGLRWVHVVKSHSSFTNYTNSQTIHHN